MRIKKTGLDYFSFDVDFFEDEKIEFISARFGVLGELILIKLLCKIYRNGYYLNFGEDELMLFAKRSGIDVNAEAVKDVIDEALKRDFFDKELFDKHKILSSNGIQKRYLEATSRRNRVEIIKEFIAKGSNVNIDNKNVYIIDYNVYAEGGNAPKAKHSIAKHSKAKNTNKEKGIVSFIKPSISEITEYAKSIGFDLDGQEFIDYYSTNGWVVGKYKTPMKDWRAAIRTWQRQRALNDKSQSNLKEKGKYANLSEVY